MKKFFFRTISAILILASLIFSFATTSLASEPPITVYVNGEKISFDVEPIIDNGRTLVPLRYIFEALGAKVDWRGETSTAVATKGTDTIEITVGQNVLYKNSNPTQLDVGAKLINGRTLVPARAVSEGMGCDVSWDGENRRVIITEKGALPYYQLSARDADKIRNSEKKIVENIVYESIYDSIRKSGSTEFYKGISGQADGAIEFINSVCQSRMMSEILKVQEESETYYLVNEYEKNTDETINKSYAELSKNLNMSPSDIFTLSYEKTPKGKDLLLITMKKKGSDISFAAIVAEKDSVRYFILSKSKEIGFCEIKDSGMSGYIQTPTDKKSLLAAIDKA